MRQSIPAVPIPRAPDQPPGIFIFLKEMGKCPGVGTKKEGKCQAPEIVAFQHFCSFFLLIGEFVLLWNLLQSH